MFSIYIDYGFIAHLNSFSSPQYLYWNAGLSPEVLRDFEGISHSFVRHTLSVNRIVQALNSADGDKERSEAALEELRAEFRSTKQVGLRGSEISQTCQHGSLFVDWRSLVQMEYHLICSVQEGYAAFTRGKNTRVRKLS